MHEIEYISPIEYHTPPPRAQKGRPPSLRRAIAPSLQVMKSMASKGRKLISGEAGARLMQEFTPTSGTRIAG